MTRDSEWKPGMLPLSAHGYHVVCLFRHAQETLRALARCLSKAAGTGADFDLLPMDEAPRPADDAGTA